MAIEPEDIFASDTDRAEFLIAEREHRWGTVEMALHVDAETGEMTSPGGQINDEEMAVMQLRYQLRRPGLS